MAFHGHVPWCNQLANFQLNPAINFKISIIHICLKFYILVYIWITEEDSILEMRVWSKLMMYLNTDRKISYENKSPIYAFRSKLKKKKQNKNLTTTVTKTTILSTQTNKMNLICITKYKWTLRKPWRDRTFLVSTYTSCLICKMFH